MKTTTFFAAVAVFALAPLALADPVIYSQDLAVFDGESVGDDWSDFDLANGSSQQIADDFVLREDKLLTDIHWWGVYYTAIHDDNFTVRLFADDGGDPQLVHWWEITPETVNRTDSGYTRDLNGNPLTVFKYDYDLEPGEQVNLAAGTQYYLSVVNDSGDACDWAWSYGEYDPDSGASFAYWYREQDGDAWDIWQEGNMAFELTGRDEPPIPEPTSALLFGLGIVGLVGHKKLFRNASGD
jgi:hypothetical protein